MAPENSPKTDPYPTPNVDGTGKRTAIVGSFSLVSMAGIRRITGYIYVDFPQGSLHSRDSSTMGADTTAQGERQSRVVGNAAPPPLPKPKPWMALVLFQAFELLCVFMLFAVACSSYNERAGILTLSVGGLTESLRMTSANHLVSYMHPPIPALPIPLEASYQKCRRAFSALYRSMNRATSVRNDVLSASWLVRLNSGSSP